jgi:Spy/CpxP family protein refolding chaperone
MSAETPEDDPALNLTDDQKSKIASIRSDTKDQMKAINKDTTLSDTDKQNKIKELRKTTRAQVWAVMTPDQQKQWMADAHAAKAAKRTGSAPE